MTFNFRVLTEGEVVYCGIRKSKHYNMQLHKYPGIVVSSGQLILGVIVEEKGKFNLKYIDEKEGIINKLLKGCKNLAQAQETATEIFEK